MPHEHSKSSRTTQSIPEIMSTLANVEKPRIDESETYILRLPNELLSKILDLTFDTERPYDAFWFTPRAHPVTAGLSRVCRGFEASVTPKLYSELDIVSSVTKNVHADESTTLLYRTLEKNSTKRTYCRKLAISLVKESEPEFDPSANLLDSTFDVIRWLSSTTHLSITGIRTTSQDVDSPNLHTLISRALNLLPRLMTLRIYGKTVSLPTVLEGLGDMTKYHTNLSALIIYYINEAANTSQWQALQGIKGTAPMTKLKLKRFGQTPEVLEALIKWPIELQKLSFRPQCAWSTGHSGLFDNWSFAVMQPILEAQMANLRELSILDLDTGDIKNLDLTSFKKLEVLKLPSTLTGYDKEDVSRLVSPNLRVFKWKVVTWNSEVEEQVDDFGQVQEDWIHELVKVAIERKVKLREVFVKFTPIILGNIDHRSIYPWDRISNVARHSEQHGIQIHHSPPTISRDEFRGISVL
ncbi:hypothetical protein FSARC_11818 [Fusarium sarcochroum]|uniref:F-box domain-containing protein n=1 Tax=Fusarium sarcochroum TaxID=1208366 RepID=A0A8H4WZN2_9HYPO|nr:hypothetical protein FSARC_11818 [Fusarium sarcochroum]